MRLQQYWAAQGCLIWQPYSEKVGAGTANPATVLRVLGPEPWNVAYVEPSYRPADGSGVSEAIFPLYAPNGIALSPDGSRLYVAETYSRRVLYWNLSGPGRIAPNPRAFDGSYLLTAAMPKLLDPKALGIDAQQQRAFVSVRDQQLVAVPAVEPLHSEPGKEGHQET